ncbi:hypothetical protein KAI46_01450, partial [bacterium]|nr:hypothetical protein [bacterium]
KPQQPGPQWLWFIVAGAAFWAAMHSKEMAITLPLTILFYEIYAAPPETNTIRKKLTPIMLILLIPLMFLFFAWQIGLFNQTWINIGFRSKRLWSPSIHFLSESRAFFHYWKLLLIPLPESLSLHHEFQPSPDHLDLGALSAVFGHLALLIFAWKIRRKAPLAGFGIVWFYLVLGPPYLFLPQKELLVEYKTYLAAPGVAILTAGLLTAINDISERRNWLQIRYFIYAIVGGWIFCLTMITYQRQTIFQNPIMIWSDVLEKYPDSRRALNNRAVAWLKQKSPQKALTDLSTLVANHPEYARGFENRGRLRLYLKDYNGALADFDRTLTLLPNEPELQQTIREIEKLKELAQRTIGRPPENLE